MFLGSAFKKASGKLPKAPDSADSQLIPNVDISSMAADSVSKMEQEVLQKSYDKAPEQLVEALCDIVDIREVISNLPLLGDLVTKAEATLKNTLVSILAPIPLVGPQLLNLAKVILRKMKTKILSMALK